MQGTLSPPIWGLGWLKEIQGNKLTFFCDYHIHYSICHVLGSMEFKLDASDPKTFQMKKKNWFLCGFIYTGKNVITRSWPGYTPGDFWNTWGCRLCFHLLFFIEKLLLWKWKQDISTVYHSVLQMVSVQWIFRRERNCHKKILFNLFVSGKTGFKAGLCRYPEPHKCYLKKFVFP